MSEPPDATVPQARDLVKRFGTVTAVDGLRFSLRRGEVFGLLGLPLWADFVILMAFATALFVASLNRIRKKWIH